MPEMSYWKALVSNALRKFQLDHNIEAVQLIRDSNLRVEHNSHDNWNGGIDYWDLIFELKFKEYSKIEEHKDALEGTLLEMLEKYHNEEYNPIANVLIQTAIEHFIDWQAILPENKESTIRYIEEEHRLLEAIATGTSYKDDGIEEQFKNLHTKICTIAKKAGFEHPIKCNSLAEWWIQIKGVGGYADRRAYIHQLYTPVITLLGESDDSIVVDFSRIASRSDVVRKAVEDAEVFIRQGSYDSAVDRIHTAFHGYLEQLLAEHGANHTDNEGLSSLYTKLHSFYAQNIQPNDVGERIRTILRSAGGMVNAVNELRNNNTIAHPNGQLIQGREAQLVIRLVNAIVDYIEDVEEYFE